jgi:hypothetical protein
LNENISLVKRSGSGLLQHLAGEHAFFAYATNNLIDTDNAVILDVEASRAIRQAEVGALRTMIDRAARRFGITPRHLAADSAYGPAANPAWLVKERQIEPHIPVFDKSNRTDGTFSIRLWCSTLNAITTPVRRQAAGAVPADIRVAALGHHQGRDAVMPLKQVGLPGLRLQGEVLSEHAAA